MIETQLDPMQVMVACLAQWRHSIVEHDDTGLQDQVRDIESVSRMLHSVMLDAVAEMESRNVAANTGFGTTKRLLTGMLRLSAAEARTRVTHATRITPRRTLGGEVLPPKLPNTAAALAAGEIGPAQVRVIAETIDAIPTSVSVADRETAEADLAAMPGRSVQRRCTRSDGTSSRTSIRTVRSPATTRTPRPLRGTSGSGSAATGGSDSRDSWSQSTVPRSGP